MTGKRIRIGLALALLFTAIMTACSNAPASSGDKDTGDSQEKPVTLYVTRHGKTMLNTADRVQGWADSPLTEPGVEVAVQLGKGLTDIPFEAAYSSDSGRAIETANLVLGQNGGNTELKQDKRLREWNFGKFEGDLNANMWSAALGKLGITMEEIGEQGLNLEQMADTIASIDETGQAESWADISARVKESMDAISAEAAANGGGNVLVVSHGLTISAFIQLIDPEKVPPEGLENASVTKVVYKDGTYSIESVNDMSYVEQGKAK